MIDIKKLFTFSLLIVGCTCGFSQDTDSSWRSQYDSCKYYFNQSDFSRAATLLSELIPSVEKNIEDTSAYYEMRNLIGISLSRISRAEEGVKYLESTVAYYSTGVAPDQNYFTALFQLGIIHFSLKNYTQAEPNMEKAILFYKESMGEKSKDYLTLLSNLATIEVSLKNYKKADSVYTHLIELKQEFYGQKHPETYSSISSLAVMRFNTGDFSGAEETYLQMSQVLKDSLGDNNPLLAENYMVLGAIYRNQNKNEEAINYYLKTAEIQKALNGDKSASYANALTSLGLLYKSIGQTEQAQRKLEEAITIFQQNNAENEFNYILSLSTLGSIYRSLGQFSQSETFLSKAVESGKKNEASADYANILNNLALLYDETGRFNEAENLYKEVLEITQKTLGKKSPEYATTLNNLASLYKTLGRFDQSEVLYKQSLQIRKETLGTSHIQYGESLNNLGSLYQTMGRNKEAESHYVQALEIAKNSLGEKNAEYASYLNNLAGLYEHTEQFTRSEPLYEQAVAIIKETLGENHPDYGTAVNNLALLYEKTGKFSQAEALFKRDLEIVKNSLGTSHPNYAYALSNLAGLYENMAKYSEAEKLYKEAIALRKNIFGEKHPEYATVTNNLARVYTAMGKLEEAEKLWLSCINNYLFQIKTYFPSLSEREKEEFYNTISPKFEQFNSFCLLRKKENPAILSVMYNNQLVTKALLLNSSNKVRERILNSGDENLINSFKLWQQQKELLARYYSQKGDEAELKSINIDSLEKKANELEKELSLRSELFKSTADKQNISWQDVQKKLKAGEAVIEIIRFRKYKADSAGIYSANVVYYAALIVKPETVNNPDCVLMENGEDLEGKFMKYYRNSIKFKIQDDHAYNQFWRRIKEVLGETQKVFISPDGVYNQLNLYSIRNPDTKKFLIDETEIRQVTNSRDLLDISQKKPAGNKVILLGDPEFYIDSKPQSAKITSLPGTQKEVMQINSIVSQNNWTGTVYTGKSATEETIKDVNDPKVLHIATHGFFDQDEDINEEDKDQSKRNPLLRSGLMLAGSGEPSYSSSTSEDGILTAFEAMNMDLDNTDLVVLSACETGLGEIRNGEGVYGLQRAFRVAGAKTILISLWKVNDETTQKLMIYFYEEWLKTGDKRIAFQTAQNKIRQEFADPYYWGAFVMVGE